MSVLKFHDRGGQLALDEEECRAAGAALAGKYRTAQPFPHIAIDDFINADILRDLLTQFPGSEGLEYFDRDQERLKYQYHPQICGPKVRNLLTELNSQAFLAFLSAMTGYEGLISDPYYAGGGLHETKRGGHLGVHADFNVHGEMHVVRRLNLLVYLNDDWDEAWGGNLELWDTAMKSCQKKVAPIIGRAVVFNTSLDSFHGHPDPLACPPERSRRSIATYYYQSPVEGLANVPKRTTVFKPRPDSKDRTDWKVKAQHLWKDWVPPAVQRMMSKSRAD